MDRIFHQDITAMMKKVWMEKIDAVLSLTRELMKVLRKLLFFFDEKTQKVHVRVFL